MTLQGRSLDDLPLAAYTTGMQPDPRLEDAEPDPASTPEPVARSAAATASHAAGSDGQLDLSTEPGGAGTLTAGRLGRGLPQMPPLPALPVWLAHPRAHLRDPRLLLTGVVAVGVILLALSLVGGGAGPLGAAVASPTPGAPVVVATPEPVRGEASVEATGKLPGSFVLTGMSGFGPAVGSHIDATWSDVSGATLGLAGLASPGTRTTDARFVLTWTIPVEGVPVTFTSDAGECTVGMAVQPKSVTGSFVCKKLKSPDGKLVVDARGTYRT
jgi:hypothetical protein